ncbi:BLUF domain-containing protein [Bosea sp. (in: a-proteobacteria)]|uniref:BLUF domain-containing protein n=1 Tax=Bosea sp. (in: a-proteobacteria) TaxID=1871050 RepID=UPI00261431F5|nr:BLUF domain-containing protein [Bosea sp. (in: a-proteobacteria)]MCO5093450.1 BLUF domain-containing protein [Bosea sp. (in: a-proteobacteria)]
MSLIRLVYASESRLVDTCRSEELDRILASARRLNERNGITGFLLATDSAFAQVLEGAREAVAETYGRIGADPRHAGLKLLCEQPIAARSFPGWAMGISERDETTTFIFGLYGVTPEEDLQVQPLDVLLDLAGELAGPPA